MKMYDIDWQYGSKDKTTLEEAVKLFRKELEEMNPGDHGIEFWVTIREI